MLRQVLALSKLIDELYALARADVGALDCRREPLDLWQLALEEAQSFGDAPAHGRPGARDSAPRRRRHRARRPRPHAPGAAQPVREQPALHERARRRVRLSARVADGTARSWRIDDSAPGVPDAALARLGERFYRVDASRSRAGGGAGLGLALCTRLVEAQGGTLAFAHSPMGGLRVTLAAAVGLHAMNSTITIVEDEPELAALVADYARAAGYRPDRASATAPRHWPRSAPRRPP